MTLNHYSPGKDGEFHYLDWGGSGPPLHIAHATGYCAGVYTPLTERLTPVLRVEEGTKVQISNQIQIIIGDRVHRIDTRELQEQKQIMTARLVIRPTKFNFEYNGVF